MCEPVCSSDHFSSKRTTSLLLFGVCPAAAELRMMRSAAVSLLKGKSGQIVMVGKSGVRSSTSRVNVVTSHLRNSCTEPTISQTQTASKVTNNVDQNSFKIF